MDLKNQTQKREIKFRGYAINYWAYGSYIKVIENNKIFNIIGYENDSYVYVDSESIGQFTGLKDINGIEIYEGEILYNNDRKEHCIVKFDIEKAMFIVEYLESKDKFPLWESISNLNYSVGNISENPELLENGWEK